MNPPPATVGNAITLYYILLDKQFHRTGNTTHFVGGQIVYQFVALAICQYVHDRGYYLFYCDEEWSTITDTYHDSIEDVMDQATFEYNGLTPDKWQQFEEK